MSDRPTHLIMVVNRDACDLKLVSAHDETEAEAAFQNLSALFATTRNDVHKVAIPLTTGFTIGDIKSSQGVASDLVVHPGMHVQPGAIITDQGAGPVTLLPEGRQPKAKNGVSKNHRGEYVQKLADGSEIISTSDFSGEDY
jgi:hypothetical protein